MACGYARRLFVICEPPATGLDCVKEDATCAGGQGLSEVVEVIAGDVQKGRMFVLFMR